jgi:hypothetical protein
VVIEGAGHGLYASAAALYNTELLQFISTCRRGRIGAHLEPQVARQ